MFVVCYSLLEFVTITYFNPMKSRTLLQTTGLLILSLIVASCIPVKNVEKAWENAKADDALVGTWTGDQDAMVSFAKTDRGFLVTAGTTGLEGGCKSFEASGHQYLIVASLKASLLGFDAVDEDSKSGTLLRYKVEGDTLKMYSFDGNQLKDAVKAEKVKGIIDDNDSTQLAELDEATIKWLGEAAEGSGWDEKVYQKAK